ncbi:MAG: polysaccharide biosynthesis protein [Magnetococcus sp. WYHC-3]
MNNGSYFLTRKISRVAPFVVDLCVMALAYVFAYVLRFNFDVPAQHVHEGERAFFTVAVLQFATLLAFGCYRLLWRYISVCDVPRFLYAISASTMALLALRFLLPEVRILRPPISIALINGVFVLGGLLLMRVVWRALCEHETHGAVAKVVRRTLLIGAGSAGNTVARELRTRGLSTVEVVGFLDDDPAKQGTYLQGIPVLGVIADLSRIAQERRVQEVIVSMVRAPRDVVRQVVHACEAIKLPVRIAPGYFEILDGTLTVSQLREVDIADLLGREEVDFGGEADLVRFVGGQRVLITGAGGSIGAELARQVARLGPESLVLVERNEHALYEIERLLRAMPGGRKIVPELADIGDVVRMRAVLAAHQPQIVLHAAAHKHVPMLESNVAEAVRNNVLATRTLGELAVTAGVKVFVQLSTDKAVNPTSVMGATKRLAELALQDLNVAGSTRFAAVRFGNVLGASGSVVPLFREQIRHGGPVTVTHPDMQRYFMTIPEAARLVLHAASLATGGEIFILDMGQPVRIVELAEEMISLSGFKPYEEIGIAFSGIRPGEKLFEELSTDEEHAGKTSHARIYIGKIARRSVGETASLINRLRMLCDNAAADAEIGAALWKSAT